LEYRFWEVSYSSLASAKIFVTYPRGEDPCAIKGVRGFNIVADCCSIYIFNNWAAFSISDGCNWGPRAREASYRACKNFIKNLRAESDGLINLNEAHKILRICLDRANSSIAEGYGLCEAGTTTLLGGFIGKLSKPVLGKDTLLSCINVGDGRAFIYRSKKKKVEKIVFYEDEYVKGLAFDVGGRLGPYLGDGKPDLRNLEFFDILCNSGDYIICLTDGVYSNFDPEYQGILPDFFGLPDKTWDVIPEAVVAGIKRKYLLKEMEKIINAIPIEELNTTTIVDKFHIYIFNIINPTRAFMEKNPTQRVPANYAVYPGRLDHATILVYKII